MSDNQQALVFINARGFAAISLCHACGWVAECKTCDGNLTLHMQPYELHCHKCDRRYQVPKQCPNCQSTELHNSGFGTEQTEHQLKHLFPDTHVIRVDRDSTQRKNSFAEYIEQVKTGKPCILVGTQMLAKGHHLPNLGLVVILDTDRGLFSADFRAAERMGNSLPKLPDAQEERASKATLSFKPTTQTIHFYKASSHKAIHIMRMNYCANALHAGYHLIPT